MADPMPSDTPLAAMSDEELALWFKSQVTFDVDAFLAELRRRAELSRRERRSATSTTHPKTEDRHDGR